MMTDTEHDFEHHVIGAVHEIVVDSDDPATIRHAIEHERDHCHAQRVIIDLSRLETLEEPVVSTLVAVAADGERWMVRLESHGHPITVSEIEVSD